MKNTVFHIAFYSNTTRVNIEKIPGVFEYLKSPGVIESVDFCAKNKIMHLVPWDIYEQLAAKFSKFYKKNDEKERPGLILFMNHEMYAYLGRRDKIWSQHCPECKTKTRKTPFRHTKIVDGKEIIKHGDIYECPECGMMFHISLSGGESYV